MQNAIDRCDESDNRGFKALLSNNCDAFSFNTNHKRKNQIKLKNFGNKTEKTVGYALKTNFTQIKHLLKAFH